MRPSKAINSLEFLPSVSSIDGDILVKGKTLGRWTSKKFLLDPEQKMLIIDPKKKMKMYDLRGYQIKNQEIKKDRISFDLEPVTQGKKITLGSTDQKFITQIVNMLIACCFKSQENQAAQRQSIIHKKSVILEQPLQKVDSDDDEFQPRTNLPYHFNNNDIINYLQDSYQENLFEIESELNNLTIWKNKKNLTLRKAHLTIDNPNIPAALICNLINDVEQMQKWNKFVTNQSKQLRPIQDEKSVLIYEERLYKDLFAFPREFLYLRHVRKQNEKFMILDKSVDAIDIQTNVVRGTIRFAIWKIFQQDKTIRVQIVCDATNSGLSYPKEDAFFLNKYLTQLKELSEYINREQEELIKNEVLCNDPFEVKSRSLSSKQQSEDQELQKNQKSEQQDVSSEVPTTVLLQQPGKSNPEDEFYDCDDYDEELNNKLKVESKQDIDKELGESSQQDIQESQESSGSQEIVPVQMNLIPNDEISWTKWKMQQYSSGENASYHIRNKYRLESIPLNGNEHQLLKLPEGINFLFREDWQRDDNKGGLRMINPQKINAQKKVIKFLLKRIGSNLLSGKSLMSISLPVDIFETRSTTERLCNAMTSAPLYLDKAAHLKDPMSRLKEAFGFAMGFLVSFLSMEKPFNPILGETYQGWIDKCPIYAEQISHHPPITALQFFGRGYKILGQLEMVANIHSNSVTGKNIGPLAVHFPDQVVHIILSPGIVTGTAFGDRMFLFNGKTILLDTENLIGIEVMNQPEKKYCTNLGIKHQSLLDFLCGGIFKISDQSVQRFKKEGYKKYTGFEKNDLKDILHRIEGRWTKEVFIDNQTIINIPTHQPCVLEHEQFPLASDSNYRMDLLWWKLRDFDMAQKTKEQMEVAQRNDKKLRENYKKSNKH